MHNCILQPRSTRIADRHISDNRRNRSYDSSGSEPGTGAPVDPPSPPGRTRCASAAFHLLPPRPSSSASSERTARSDRPGAGPVGELRRRRQCRLWGSYRCHRRLRRLRRRFRLSPPCWSPRHRSSLSDWILSTVPPTINHRSDSVIHSTYGSTTMLTQ